MRRTLNALLLILAACTPQYEDVPTKLVGVGYDPDEIGPSPTPYGGVVEYSLVNFTGGALSLAMMSLGSFDEVSSLTGAAPPYRAVYGFSYIFDTKLSAADSLGGVTSVPPDVEDTCYTTFEASGPIGSFTTVDVGSYMEFNSADGSAGFRMDRLPADYPGNPRDLFIYYSSFDTYQSASFPQDDGTDSYSPLRKSNFPIGQSVEFRFPGGMAPSTAPVSSMPQPSTAVGNTVLTLPNEVGAAMLEWDGPRYDLNGASAGDGPQSTCLNFAAAATDPASAEECAGVAGSGDGQIYTGPWDTSDGKVTFRWVPNESNPNEIVSLAVRFLGPVEEDDSNFKTYAVSVPQSADADGATGDGKRGAAACEEGEWAFDSAFKNADGSGLTTTMQGNPLHNLSEVTCRLADDGEFELNSAIIQDALTYARRYNAGGAVFYLARSTEADIVVPPAMNTYEQRKEISPVKLTSRAIDIGRFWYGE